MLMLNVYKMLVDGTHPSVREREIEREREHSIGLCKKKLFGELGITLGSTKKVPKYMK